MYEGDRRQYLNGVELTKKVEFLRTFYMLDHLSENQSDRWSFSRQAGRFEQV